MMTPDEQAFLERQWDDALLAARLFAIDPHGLGVVLRAKAGPVRQRWLYHLKSLLPEASPARTLPNNITDDRLIGGLDLAATLQAGRPVTKTGLLAEANGGVVIAAMAERMSLDAASRLTAALDFSEVRMERDGLSDRFDTRFGVLALDEGEADNELDRTPPALSDRLAFHLDLDALSIHIAVEPLDDWDIADRRGHLDTIAVEDEVIEALCVLSLKLGILSLRAPQLAVRAAKAHAALQGRFEVSEADIAVAARLVLGPRATMLPDDNHEEPEEVVDETPPDPSQNHDNDNDPQHDSVGKLEDLVLEAVKAGLPEGLLAQLKSTGKSQRSNSEGGRHGGSRVADLRGRPLSSRRGDLRAGKRLDVIGTLRTAAPWQKLRRSMRRDDDKRSATFDVRTEDFQIMRYKERAETATIFAVDASGSTALSRLGEAKGAVELLLAESYSRRDHVALVSFRNVEADLLLAPTRSLVRAKRALAALPGGGGTPLASGIETALILAEDANRRGRTPTFVLLTDGSANIALDGNAGRKAAFGDALEMAKRMGALQFKSLVVDISRRKNVRAQELALAMGAHYIPLPNVDAQSLSNAVRAVQ